MRTIIVSLAMALAGLGACGGGDDGGAGRELLKRGMAARGRACACNDAACADKVRGEHGRWLEEHAAGGPARGASSKLSRGQQVQLTALVTETQVCLARFAPSGPGLAPGPRPAPGATPTGAPPASESREPPPVPETPETVEPPPAKPTPAMAGTGEART